METKEIITKEQDKKKRLDAFLTEHFSDMTRNHIQNMIEKSLVLVDGKKVKCGYGLKPNQKIVINIEDPKKTDIMPENIPIDIVYEDSDLLVINKPQGMVVHPASTVFSGTLVNALLNSVKDLSGINGELRPGIVHRLDKDTSGLMLVAKNDKAHNNLAKQIQEKSCERTYWALVCGNVKKDEGSLTTQIGRNPKDRKKMAVLLPGEGRTAISEFRVLKRYAGFTLMEWKLKTGRTHQIRVHAKHIGHPIACDPIYGTENFGHVGQLLHSKHIKFVHPNSKKIMEFDSNLPTYFENILKKLSPLKEQK